VWRLVKDMHLLISVLLTGLNLGIRTAIGAGSEEYVRGEDEVIF
jgi:hypothetical protein